MNGARGIRSEKLIENQYIEGYAKFLGSKRVEWEEERNVMHSVGNTFYFEAG